MQMSKKKANDWDFSKEGRRRQSNRMNKFALEYLKKGHHVVADFVCPTPEARSLFKPDHLFWMNTIEKGKFEDTNNLFVKPKKI